MSDALPISAGAGLNSMQSTTKSTGVSPQSASTTQNGDATAAAGGDAENAVNKGQTKDFPSLFKSLTQTDAAQAGMLMTPMLDPGVLAKATDKADATDKAVATNDATALAGLPNLAADAGKGLPQLAWSGYVAVANNGEAAAFAQQGDQNGVINSPVITARDIPNAVLKAQEQVVNAQLQQAGATAASGTDFNAIMGKEQAPVMQMEHKFLTDNLVGPQAQTQNTNVPTINHGAALTDLSAISAGTSARGAENTATSINVPVQNPQWAQQVGDRVHWMVGQNLNQADIHLNPPELGSLKVHIQMHGDQTNVNFSSPHAQVRDALDAAVPRLREMLHDAGLSLGDVNVSGQALAQHQSRDPNAQQGQSGRSSGSGRTEESPAIVATSAVQQLRPNSMLDVYA